VLGYITSERFERESTLWPARWTAIDTVHETSTVERTVTELLFRRTDAPGIPVAIVWDGTGVEPAARVYANRSHFGGTQARPPIVAPETDPVMPPELADYRQALNTADWATMRSHLRADAVVSAPNGLTTGGGFVDLLSGLPGLGVNGVPIQFCTVTTSGAVSACEFISWRRPPHCGLSVYSFGDDRRIHEIRTYEGPIGHGRAE
jgi:hypothetical protein